VVYALSNFLHVLPGHLQDNWWVDYYNLNLVLLMSRFKRGIAIGYLNERILFLGKLNSIL